LELNLTFLFNNTIIIKNGKIRGTPDMIIEILSPASLKHSPADNNHKKSLFSFSLCIFEIYNDLKYKFNRLEMENSSLKLRIIDLQRYQTDVSKTFGILNNDLQVIDQHLRNNSITNQLGQQNTPPEILQQPLQESPLQESHLQESHLQESHLQESHLQESHLQESVQESVEEPTREINLDQLMCSLDRNLTRLS